MRFSHAVALTSILAVLATGPAWAGKANKGVVFDKVDPTPGLAAGMLEGPMAHVEEIIYAVRGPGREWHFYANFGYVCHNPESKKWGTGPGQLVRLNLRTGEKKILLEDPDGAVRDPIVSYDAKRILFSYRKGGSEYYHLYEIDVDGGNLRQITDGPWDDIEATYLPAGGIMFVSSRCRRYVPCLHTQVAVLFRCEADGSNLHQISTNVENETTPWVMPDGRVMFMRWEYVERGVMDFHHLWTINPDGTGAMVAYGNMTSAGYAGLREAVLMTEAKPIPGSDKIVAIFCDKHGRSEHRGHVATLELEQGPDALAASRLVSKGFPTKMRHASDITTDAWRDPWAFSENCFLVASHRSLVLMDGLGNYEPIHTLDDSLRGAWIHEPRPLIARKREPIIPARTDWSRTTGTMMMTDVTIGRNMGDIQAGQIRKLLLMEVLPNPVHFSTGMDAVAGSHFIKRIIGTVPVAEDGSAHFNMPAMRAIMMVALDGQDKPVKRMNSFVTVMPGETMGCVGCHEQRTLTPPSTVGKVPVAMAQAPVDVTPIAGVPEIIDFNRDVQPILNRRCVKCHNREKAGKGVVLVDEQQLMFSDSYEALKRPWHVRVKGGNSNPYSRGAAASKLIEMLEKGHHKVKLSQAEMATFRLWVEAGGCYAGTYGAFGYDIAEFDLDRSVLEKKCYSCHMSDKKDRSVGRIRRRGKQDTYYWPRSRYLGRWVNMDNIDASRILRAALAKDAGGHATVSDAEKTKGWRKHLIVFSDKSDPAYQALRQDVAELVAKAKANRWTYSVDDWQPNEHYIREMKRYGVLPDDYDRRTGQMSPFEMDRRYYELFYPQGTGKPDMPSGK